jgi:hypothetical protein
MTFTDASYGGPCREAVQCFSSLSFHAVCKEGQCDCQAKYHYSTTDGRCIEDVGEYWGGTQREAHYHNEIIQGMRRDVIRQRNQHLS